MVASYDDTIETRIANEVLQPISVPVGAQPGIPSYNGSQYLLYNTMKSAGPTRTSPVYLWCRTSNTKALDDRQTRQDVWQVSRAVSVQPTSEAGSLIVHLSNSIQ